MASFLEYTLRPIIEDTNELLERMQLHRIPTEEIIRHAVKLYMIDKLLELLKAISVTGMICSTLYLILSSSHLMTP